MLVCAVFNFQIHFCQVVFCSICDMSVYFVRLDNDFFILYILDKTLYFVIRREGESYLDILCTEPDRNIVNGLETDNNHNCCSSGKDVHATSACKPEAIREGASETFERVCKTLSNPYCDMIMKRALPEATRRWVRSPASLALYSRSRPIMPPKIAAINMRMIISVVILLYLFFAKIV